MLNNETSNTDFKRSNAPEAYALSSLLFKRERKKQHRNLFMSVTSNNNAVSENINETPDYTKLINDIYPKKVYAHFLNIVVNTPNIIIEEGNGKNVAKEVKEDPWKRYSTPTALHNGNFFINKSEVISKEKNSQDDDSETNLSVVVDKGTCATPMKMSTRQEHPSFLTSDINNSEPLTDEQIKQLIEYKMKNLEKFNRRLENRDSMILIKKYNLSPATIEAIKKLQSRIRGWIMKKRFFKAMRMNQYIEQKRNYLLLKRCLDKFENNNRGGRHATYFKNVVNVFDEK